MSIMSAEPHSGTDPQCSKTVPISPESFSDCLCAPTLMVCVSHLNRDSDLEMQRRQNSNTEVEHAFIARRQISDPEENTTRESPEVLLTCNLFA